MASVYTMLFLTFGLLDYCSELEETGEEDGTKEQMKCYGKVLFMENNIYLSFFQDKM